MELLKNGAAPRPQPVEVSFVRDDYANGRRRYKSYAMIKQQQLDPLTNTLRQVTVVIGEITVEAPNLEVAKVCCASLLNMLSKLPPEIEVVGGNQ